MYDIAIIGGGIIGLTTAYEYLQRLPNNSLILIEKEKVLASHQTGNNSGVIHSGIYYKPGSLKATNCRTGIIKLLEFCNENQIKYELCGKLIVATDSSELKALENLYIRGVANGITDLKLLKENELKTIEPHVKGIKAIHSPSTGIINYDDVCKACAISIKKHGAKILLNTKAVGIKNNVSSIIKTTNGDINAKLVINCSGLFSDRVAKYTLDEIGLKIIPFRGEYYKIKKEKRYLVNNLIYPVPDEKFPFLGVHFTRRLNGEIEAGPNAVLAFKREGYNKTDISLNDIFEIITYPAFWKLGKKYWKVGTEEMIRSFSKRLFANALQKLIPDITVNDIERGGSGVRAQALMSNGKLLDDFKIIKSDNIIHILNSPSPAATSAFSIADHIIEQIN